jgi:branched-chain amino acid transport system permease protein
MDLRTQLSRFSLKGLVPYIAVLIIVALLPLIISSVFYRNLLISTFIFIIVTASLRLIAITGQYSMGHAGFMGVGAYASAVICKFSGISPFATIVLGVAFTFVLAFLVGLLFARLRGSYFAMITMFFGIALLGYNQVLSRLTKGQAGLVGIEPLFTGENSQVKYYYFILTMLVLALILMHRLEVTRVGLRWKAVAQSHLVAASTGINEYFERVLAFSIGCAFAAFAGGLYAHYYGILSYDSFTFLASMQYLVYALTGGLAYFAGPIVGTSVLVVIPEVFRGLHEYRLYLYAGIMVFVLFVMPRGLCGAREQIVGLRQARRRAKRSAAEGAEYDAA